MLNNYADLRKGEGRLRLKKIGKNTFNTKYSIVDDSRSF